MLRLTEIKVPLNHVKYDLEVAIFERIGVVADELVNFSIVRRSYDARKQGQIFFIYTLDVELRSKAKEIAILEKLINNSNILLAPDSSYYFVTQAQQDQKPRVRPVIIGSGPCGLFAGLILAQMGFNPIILERGKTVRERTKDTFSLWRNGQLNPESNAQFGEGGAGTFSDGKLYSQIKDPKHYGRKVLTEFIKAGASPEILYVSKPHIGTFRLVGILEKIRETILSFGGEFHFQSRVDNIEIKKNRVCGVKLTTGEFITTDHVI